MNSRTLKLIALFTMIIDHVGHFLFPELIILRVIGRIAFPIFTYLFALSARYTHNRLQLGIRVWVSAFLGQIILTVSHAEIIGIFFLFGLALILFELIDRGLDFSVLIFAYAAEYFGVDYGAYGILTLYFFYKYNDQFSKQALSYIFITLLYVALPFMDPQNWSYIPLILSSFFSYSWRYFIQALSIVSLILLAFYKKDKPVSFSKPYDSIEKYFFYVFYPLHIALLAYLGA